MRWPKSPTPEEKKEIELIKNCSKKAGLKIKSIRRGGLGLIYAFYEPITPILWQKMFPENTRDAE